MSLRQVARYKTMDDAEFKRKLSEVAEWKIPDTPRETSLNAKKKRGKKSNEELYCEAREEIFYEEFGGVNPTYAPMLTRIKIQPVDCPDCGQHCESGRQTSAQLYQKNGKTAWRQQCLNCRMFENPYTGEFNLTGSAASIKFHDFMRGSKGIYKTPGNEQRSKRMLTQPNTVKNTIEDDSSIITIYCNSRQE